MRRKVAAEFSVEQMTAALPVNALSETLIEYMKTVCAMRATFGKQRPDDWHYDGMEDFLLKHGRFWTPRELPSYVPMMTPNYCFQNAFRLASRRKNLRYVEGLVMSVLPLHHAWCVDEQDNVIDPTWASTGTELGDVYFGVVFPVELVRSIRTPECTCVLHNYTSRYKIFREPFTQT